MGLTDSIPATAPIIPAIIVTSKTITVSPPTPSPTATPRKFGPTSTHFPTATPPPVLPTPAIPYPTMKSEQERTYVERMMNTNGGCELPCWWGINPGEATLTTLENFRAFYSKPFPQRNGTVLYGVDEYQLMTSDGSLDYYTDVGVVDLDGKILAITVHGESHNPHGGFVKAWGRYSVDQVLSRYGTPSEVRIQLSPRAEPGTSPGYALTLIYDHLGVLVTYSGEAGDSSKGDLLLACPRLDNVIVIDLKLQSPKTSTRFPLFQPTDPSGYDRSLQEATSMSLNDFYNRFKNPVNQACLEGEPTLPQ